MPTPNPSTDDSVLNSSAQATVADNEVVFPTARPATAAPPKPAASPTAPSNSPMPAAAIAFENAKTQRAGRAATADARVPCWNSDPNSRTPATAASIEETLVQ